MSATTSENLSKRFLRFCSYSGKSVGLNSFSNSVFLSTLLFSFITAALQDMSELLFSNSESDIFSKVPKHVPFFKFNSVPLRL